VDRDVEKKDKKRVLGGIGALCAQYRIFKIELTNSYSSCGSSW
jgi:hypothetical protein